MAKSLRFRWILKNWFVLGLIGSIVISLLVPEIGHTMGFGGITTKVLIIVIFLITGLTLPSETILARLGNVKFHIFTQSFIFIFIPLYFAVTAPLLGRIINEWTLIGLYGIAVLPTTISSNIVFTQASGGNVVATTFNAAVANVTGIFISPLLLSILLKTTGRVMPLEELLNIFKSLLLLMLLPIAMGQIVRGFTHDFLNRYDMYSRDFIFFPEFLNAKKQNLPKPITHRNLPFSCDRRLRYGKKLRESTSVMILLIVFITISNAVATGLFDLRGDGLSIALAYLALSHILFLAIIFGIAKMLDFSREDRISALYTAPQKTLAMGAPLLSIFFADRPELIAASIVPLSFYHLWQLIVAGFIRGIFVKKL